MNHITLHRPYKRAFALCLLSMTSLASSALWGQCVELPSMTQPAVSAEPESSVSTLSPSEAYTPPALSEPLQASLSPSRYLRALSLDLRGRLPSASEYASVRESGVTEELVASLLTSEELPEQITRHHQSLLWGRIDNLSFSNNTINGSGGNTPLWRRNSASAYRGRRVSCLDEPATFDASGAIQTTNVDGDELEGYVMVSPYWDPDNPVKVCAFDAQEASYSATGQLCSELWREPSCGCGPQLTWCASPQSEAVVRSSLIESFERLMTWSFSEGRSYLDLFEAQRLYVNGPLAHFLKHQLQGQMRYAFTPAPIDVSALPNLSFLDVDTWVPVTLSRDHAGVLTHPVFLLRFQTNRARANRFFDAFLCSPFQPPDGGLPVADEASIRDPDLQNRAGCKYCHALLEPAASHWGRWVEQGVAFLNPARFPATRADCEQCAVTGQGCSAECRDHYLTTALSDQETPYLGKLNAYVFRRDEHQLNVERGPRLLVMSEVVRQRMPRCVAQKTAEWLLGRSLEERDQPWVDALGLRFSRGGFDYRSLISDIVRSERYRRVK